MEENLGKIRILTILLRQVSLNLNDDYVDNNNCPQTPGWLHTNINPTPLLSLCGQLENQGENLWPTLVKITRRQLNQRHLPLQQPTDQQALHVNIFPLTAGVPHLLCQSHWSALVSQSVSNSYHLLTYIITL